MAGRGLFITGVVMAAFVASSADAKIVNGCLNSKEEAAKGDCHRPSFSADSRFLAFDSKGANLARHDDNGKNDVFVRDMKKGKTELISQNRKGHSPAGISFDADISASGRYVAFVSVAGGLVKGAKGGHREVYVFDRKTDKTRIVSTTSSGEPAAGDSDEPVISADGSTVAYHSSAKNLVANDLNKTEDVFATRLGAGERTIRVNTSATGVEDPAGAEEPSITADGSEVAFTAENKTELVPGAVEDEVFVKNLDTRALELISQAPGTGAPGDDLDDEAEITPDGRYVVFSSGSSNLGTGPAADAPYDRDILLRDRLTQTTTKVGVDNAGLGSKDIDFTPSISDDGTKVAWRATGSDENIYLRDIAAGTTTLITPDTKKRGRGCQGEGAFICGEVSTPAISPDGKLIGFESIGMGYVKGDAKHINVQISK